MPIPYAELPNAILYQGDCQSVLNTLPSESVHACCTSPPYFGLRDYGCDGQTGLEETPEVYVARLVDVFREVRRILRGDGTLWLNLGDSYNGIGKKELKPKDMIGIPWRVAFALQADGWYLRSDIIWAKPNPMPESVTDRPTKSHEYVFLLSKTDRYYYDAEAIKEKATQPEGIARLTGQHKARELGHIDEKTSKLGTNYGISTRNRRSVWNIAPKPYKDAHFAVWPEELVVPMIRAGTSEKGICPVCGMPWKRIVEHAKAKSGRLPNASEYSRRDPRFARGGAFTGSASVTTEWQPACSCSATDPVSAIIIDPFCGSGTTGAVAVSEGRRFIGVDLNPAYCDLARERIRRACLQERLEFI